MPNFQQIVSIAALVANVFTVVASGIAIYLFWVKRKDFSNAFRLLLNWSFQTTLTELKEKLERLNEYNANEKSDVCEICNILNEIAGQIRGNPRLVAAAPNLVERLEILATEKKLTEPRKRSIISEIREMIKNIQINSLTPDNQGE